MPGVQVWKDTLGQVHIRGSATISTGNVNGGPGLFRLPADMRPQRVLGMPVVTTPSAGDRSSGTALLRINPTTSGNAGMIRVEQATPSTGGNDNEVLHLGEIVFRTDA